ncbi:MAG TPA: tRNA glutamyl-Q(34) synthetase GluQRS [Rhodospirillaceae bacterium]|nr:tRNA glutamyl-Q(34) synthetase GluQRS [Alphaproteobacteria bacterium]OUT41760.1 MAG: tRNA glutamyl-Q(34) synthetase GluQRS [Micavibrio sp. TMED2]HCI47850.1 tRNA glutamyl-Q(34) synthetase GluQRS [Rhodospirillaceae bacterium]MAS46660.1 tRNA glutamyl-Q(34) synthetase GluQRS [Alphaproteobacteria bacterium]MAX94754.1 tRNA glutamyl-Q(34) synthetase GluQRS [Alphaproteobacteria bacterium]|tara:strand:- start:4993 stop:5877 length:885 start_codon:yes stop_codon:yes gene_type:complete
MPVTADQPRLRFAPSPSGRLHMGHAYSALFTWGEAARLGGEVLLRIEDIDHTRCRPEHVDGIRQDLAWLGLTWPEPVRIQSEHLSEYAAMLERLKAMGVVYPCFCTRAEIRAEIERSANAPHGPEGALYPGTCRGLGKAEIAEHIAAGRHPAWRLDLGAALARIGDRKRLLWHDLGCGDVTGEPEQLGDAVLARKDIATSYHLAVVHDDALQSITHVTRGKDLFHATHLHVLLQALLDLPRPVYHHHDLITDEQGVRLATRDNARTLEAMREAGVTADEIRQRLQAGRVAPETR